MEEAFEELKKEGKADVETLIKWMQDSKIIDEAKASEDKARALLKDVIDKQNVEFAKFQDALVKLAEEQKKNIGDYEKMLADQGPRVVNALKAGASAFKDALKNDKLN